MKQLFSLQIVKLGEHHIDTNLSDLGVWSPSTAAKTALVVLFLTETWLNGNLQM